MSKEVFLEDIKEALAEVKRLVSESDRDPTFIGKLRMLLWECENELKKLEKP